MAAPPPPELAIDRRATVRRIDLDAGSWVDVIDGFVRDPRGALTSMVADTPWAQQEVLRYDQYVPEQRLSAGLRADSMPLLRHTDLHLQATYRVPFEGVAALLYRDGTDFQGLHSDRGMKWLDDTRVAIVVLGARRPFVIRKRGNWTESLASRVKAGHDPDDLVLLPGEGDLLVMGGACQRDWLHGIPAADTADQRVSLTWRWTAKRGRPDTNPGYSDGRQFSGSPSRQGVRPRRSA
jgi:alkylated DNA repair dioxygenase AlkB